MKRFTIKLGKLLHITGQVAGSHRKVPKDLSDLKARIALAQIRAKAYKQIKKYEEVK